MKKPKGKPKATGIVAKKPKAMIPGTDRGQMSKMPQGPSVGMPARGPAVAHPMNKMAHAARAKRLKGVRI